MAIWNLQIVCIVHKLSPVMACITESRTWRFITAFPFIKMCFDVLVCLLMIVIYIFVSITAVFILQYIIEISNGPILIKIIVIILFSGGFILNVFGVLLYMYIIYRVITDGIRSTSEYCAQISAQISAQINDTPRYIKVPDVYQPHEEI